MKTQEVQSFRSLQRSSFLDHAAQKEKEGKVTKLSGEEEEMINRKFNNNKPLELYEGSGSVQTKQPSARGLNLDIKA